MKLLLNLVNLHVSIYCDIYVNTLHRSKITLGEYNNNRCKFYRIRQSPTINTPDALRTRPTRFDLRITAKPTNLHGPRAAPKLGGPDGRHKPVSRRVSLQRGCICKTQRTVDCLLMLESRSLLNHAKFAFICSKVGFR